MIKEIMVIASLVLTLFYLLHVHVNQQDVDAIEEGRWPMLSDDKDSNVMDKKEEKCHFSRNALTRINNCTICTTLRNLL